MNSPSKQLLRALRATEFVQSTSQTRAISSQKCVYQSHKLPSINHLRSLRINHLFDANTRHNSSAPRSSDRGPPSKEDTMTDFGSLNVLNNSPPPTTAIDACLSDGFHLDNGIKIGDGSGCLLIAGEAFSWRPWEAGVGKSGRSTRRMINAKGQWDVEKEAWGVLDLVWPKPGMHAPIFLK